MMRFSLRTRSRNAAHSMPEMCVMQGSESSRGVHKICPDQEDSPRKRIASSCPEKVVMMNWTRPRQNPFIFDMFIQLEKENTHPGGRKHSTTSRRALLDTGADFNLISHEAFAQLNIEGRPYQGLLHSLGGYSELESTILLNWHFRLSSSQTTSTYQHHAPFYILRNTSPAKFDCIIGRPWIEENWSEFVALVENNRKRPE